MSKRLVWVRKTENVERAYEEFCSTYAIPYTPSRRSYDDATTADVIWDPAMGAMALMGALRSQLAQTTLTLQDIDVQGGRLSSPITPQARRRRRGWRASRSTPREGLFLRLGVSGRGVRARSWRRPTGSVSAS